MYVATVESKPSFEYEVTRLFTKQLCTPLCNGCRQLHINRRWLPIRYHPSITEKRKTMMASKDNKRKYVDDAKEEAEDAKEEAKDERRQQQ
jgi:hypothetical protein